MLQDNAFLLIKILIDAQLYVVFKIIMRATIFGIVLPLASF